MLGMWSSGQRDFTQRNEAMLEIYALYKVEWCIRSFNSATVTTKCAEVDILKICVLLDLYTRPACLASEKKVNLEDLHLLDQTTRLQVELDETASLFCLLAN